MAKADPKDREFLTVDQMAQQQLKKTPSKLYNEAGVEIRREEISAAVQQNRLLFDSAPVGAGISVLHDTDFVRERAGLYLQSCEMSGRIPSIMGFASMGLGINRSCLYAFMTRHQDHPTTMYIKAWTDANISDNLADLSSRKVIDNATSIFLMKNQSGMADRSEFAINANEAAPMDEQPSQQDILQQALALPDYDDMEDNINEL